MVSALANTDKCKTIREFSAAWTWNGPYRDHDLMATRVGRLVVLVLGEGPPQVVCKRGSSEGVYISQYLLELDHHYRMHLNRYLPPYIQHPRYILKRIVEVSMLYTFCSSCVPAFADGVILLKGVCAGISIRRLDYLQSRSCLLATEAGIMAYE